MIDGGMYANNPSLVAYVDVVKNHPQEEAENCLLVSLGTGEILRPVYYHEAKHWGLLGWAKPTVDILFAGRGCL